MLSISSYQSQPSLIAQELEELVNIIYLGSIKNAFSDRGVSIVQEWNNRAETLDLTICSDDDSTDYVQTTTAIMTREAMTKYYPGTYGQVQQYADLVNDGIQKAIQEHKTAVSRYKRGGCPGYTNHLVKSAYQYDWTN